MVKFDPCFLILYMFYLRKGCCYDAHSRSRLINIKYTFVMSKLRDNHNGHIIVRNVQLSIYRNSFVLRRSVLWNKLPRILRDETRKEKFKMGLKSWITENVERFED